MGTMTVPPPSSAASQVGVVGMDLPMLPSLTYVFGVAGATGDKLRDAYYAHRLVMAMFPDVETGQARASMGVLFRVTDDRKGLVVRGTVAPSRSVEGCRMLGLLKEPAVRLGGVHSFELLAAPTKRQDRDGQLSFLKAAQWPEWLDRHLLGAEVLDVACEDRGEVRGFDLRRRGVVSYPSVRFTGLLRCDSVEGLQGVLAHGVGRGRSYGLGLLLLRAVG